jgi:hypothetical protein
VLTVLIVLHSTSIPVLYINYFADDTTVLCITVQARELISYCTVIVLYCKLNLVLVLAGSGSVLVLALYCILQYTVL